MSKSRTAPQVLPLGHPRAHEGNAADELGTINEALEKDPTSTIEAAVPVVAPEPAAVNLTFESIKATHGEAYARQALGMDP